MGKKKTATVGVVVDREEYDDSYRGTIRRIVEPRGWTLSTGFDGYLYLTIPGPWDHVGWEYRYPVSPDDLIGAFSLDAILVWVRSFIYGFPN